MKVISNAPTIDLSDLVALARQRNETVAASIAERVEDFCAALRAWATKEFERPITELEVFNPDGSVLLQVNNTIGMLFTASDGSTILMNSDGFTFSPIAGGGVEIRPAYVRQADTSGARVEMTNGGLQVVNSSEEIALRLSVDISGASGQANSGILELNNADGSRRFWAGTTPTGGGTSGFAQFITDQSGGKNMSVRAGDSTNWGIFQPSGRTYSYWNVLLRDTSTNTIQVEMKADVSGGDEYGFLELRRNGTVEQTLDALAQLINHVNGTITFNGSAYTNP